MEDFFQDEPGQTVDERVEVPRTFFDTDTPLEEVPFSRSICDAQVLGHEKIFLPASVATASDGFRCEDRPNGYCR